MDLDHTYMLLSAQTALLGYISPSLRAVTIEFDENENLLSVHFYYDGFVDDEAFTLASSASAEIEVDPKHPEYPHFGEELTIRLDYPQKIPVQGRLVYLRKEQIPTQYTQKKARLLLQKPVSTDVVLSLDMQDALLGKVTPALRRVSVRVLEESKELDLFFFYDKMASQTDFELADLVVFDIIKSFPEYRVNKHMERDVESNMVLMAGTRSVYSRFE